MSEKDSKNQLSNYILPISSNLLGICFLILSYVRLGTDLRATILDELISIPIILFFAASLLSYISVRSKNNSVNSERAADILFMLGLICLAGTSLYFIYNTLT
jgi:hypothetical protein